MPHIHAALAGREGDVVEVERRALGQAEAGEEQQLGKRAIARMKRALDGAQEATLLLGAEGPRSLGRQILAAHVGGTEAEAAKEVVKRGKGEVERAARPRRTVFSWAL